MAARTEDPRPTAVDDDPSTASDAVSLHTIAEQADAYAAQEAEDADFALALALEEEESQRILGREDSEPIEPQGAPESETFEPYRDDPQPGQQAPYRDDPDAEPADEEQIADVEAAADLPRRENLFLRIVRKIVKAWLCYLLCSTVFTIIVVIVVLVFAFVSSGKQASSTSPSRAEAKEAAWIASGSQDYSLNLPKLYPALEGSTSSTCKKTWEAHAVSLPCHRMILSSAWDNGNATEAKEAGADPVYYNQAVCTRRCEIALNRLDSPVSGTCVDRTNRFDFASYGKDGKAYFEARTVEEGPADVPKSLLARYDRLCSGPPKKYFGKQPLSCAEDLWMTWGIVAGKNEANLNGLDTFLEQTSVQKTIPGSRQTVVKLMPSGRNQTFTRRGPSRRVGPDRRQTECGDCLKDWLARKALSFRYGEILDPETMTPLKHRDFADRMEDALQRCDGYSLQHEHIWKAMGWWCDGAPCRKDEDSIPSTVLNVLHGSDETRTHFDLPGSALEKIPSNKKVAARTLLTAMKDMRCDGVLSLTTSDLTNPFMTSAHVLSRLCTPRCLNAADGIGTLVEAANHPGSPFTPVTESISLVHTLCKSSTPVSFATEADSLCTAGYAALNLTSLISSTPSSPPLPRASILSTFRTALTSLNTWNRSYRPGTTFQSHPSLQKLRIAESACNTCAGEMFIGQEGRWKETVDAFLADPDVNATEYVRVAREGWVVCGEMFGMRLTRGARRALFERVGLGEGVGGLPMV